jgi:hypothetical protein
MLSNPSQYSPQGLMPQFPGLQAGGFPQMNPALFGQSGAYNGAFGQESAQAGLSQQFPFGGQMNPFLQNPLAQTQFSQGPFGTNPYLQSPWQQGHVGHNPLQNSFGGNAGLNIPAQHLVPLLGQLAQQIAIQNALAQQIGIAVHQLAHQLAVQGMQGNAGGGFGAGQGFNGIGQPYIGGGAQPFGSGGPFLGNPGAQYFGPNSFAGNPQGGYGGFNPQAQAWGGNRQQTIQ